MPCRPYVGVIDGANGVVGGDVRILLGIAELGGGVETVEFGGDGIVAGAEEARNRRCMGLAD